MDSSGNRRVAILEQRQVYLTDIAGSKTAVYDVWQCLCSFYSLVFF